MILPIVNLVATSISIASPIIDGVKKETNTQDPVQVYDYKTQDDFIGDLVKGIGTGATGAGVGAGVGALFGGAPGSAVGAAVGTAVGAIIGALANNDDGRGLSGATNPNHVYAMGTGVGIGEKTTTQKNCNGLSYNASNC